MSLTIDAEPVPLQADADGVVRVGGTRVTLDTIVVAFQQGLRPRRSPSNIPRWGCPTSMPPSPSIFAIAPKSKHIWRKETDRAMPSAKKQETKYDRQEIRNRLLARRSSAE